MLLVETVRAKIRDQDAGGIATLFFSSTIDCQLMI
jgi:hypothetical protein